MAKITNSFTGGLSRDLAPTKQDNKHLYYAENFRLTTNLGLSSAVLENEEGNKLLINLPLLNTYIGHTYIRQDLIIFTKSIASYIYRIPIKQINDAIINNVTLTINGDYYHLDANFIGDRSLIESNLVYVSNNLNFTNDSTLVAFTRHESPNIEKVYFTDASNNLRSLNLIYNSQYNDLTNTDLNLDTIQRVSIIPPTLEIQNGGKLSVGKIQYSIQLYSLYGAESFFSPVSDPVFITKTKLHPNFAYELKGAEEGLFADKSVRIRTYLSSGVNRDLSEFSRIRMVAIEYTNGSLIPTIRICYDSAINQTNSILYLTDVGESLGTYSIEEFRGLSNFIFSPKYLEAKDNLLFAANIVESYFNIEDYDSRAYRFNDTNARIYENSGTYYTILPNGSWTYSAGGLGTNWSIPLTADCINRYNFFNEDVGTSYQYKYQSDLTTLGAEGINVKIGISNFHTLLDTDSSDANTVQLTDAPITTPTTGVRGTYLAGEIYRIGLIFRDDYGRRSLPQWVCDLRIPNHLENFEDICSPISNLDYLSFYLNVEIKNMPTGAVSWELIRSPRRESDKSILGYGALWKAVRINSGTLYQSFTDVPIIDTPTGGPWYTQGHSLSLVDHVYKFISPDFLIDDKSLDSGYSLRVIGFLGDKLESTGTFNDLSYPFPSGDPTPRSTGVKTKFRQIKQLDSDTVRYIDLHITDFANISEEPYGVSNGILLSGETQELRNLVYMLSTSSGSANKGQGGKGLILKFSAEPTTSYDNYADYDLYYGFIHRDVYIGMYGGYTYEARINSEYIGCGNESVTVNTPVYIYGGDTYPGMFCYVNSHVVTQGESASANGKLFSVVTFPVECSYNLYLSIDQNPISESNNFAHVMVRSSAGSYLADDGQTRFNQTQNLYAYNKSYSRDLDAEKFIPLEKLNVETKFDCRVLASNVKTNGELVDNWLKYRINQYIDVDTRYGPITNLINYNNRILFFQERGFGLLPINEQALISTNTTSKLVIGEGGILERYNYISTESGLLDRKELVSTKYGIFWTDRINSSLCFYTGGDSTMTLKDLKLEKGMNSWISESIKYDEPVYLSYNDYTKDVYFSFVSLGKTLVYNTLADEFTGLLTFSATNFIPTGKYLLSEKYTIGSNAGSKLYLQGKGNRGEYYGTVSPSKIQFIVNPNSEYSCIFDNLEWFSEHTNNITFDKLRVSDGYQDSGIININPVHRLRTWFTNIPRALYDLQGNDLERTDVRMRDYYLLVELEIPNTSNGTFKVDNIITDVTISNIKNY
jgi:hypothetical protein